MKGDTIQRAGFTLIELLVVIAIISVLAAMILPVYNQAKERGWDAKCKGNLKQLHTACQNYLFDPHLNNVRHIPFATSFEYFDRFKRLHEFPGWVDWLDYRNENKYKRKPGQPGPWWGDKARMSIQEGGLWPYVGQSLKVYLCPKFSREAVCDKADGFVNNPFDPVRSYGMNSGSPSGCAMGNMGNARSLLLFADMHTHTRDLVSKKRVCQYGLKQDEMHRDGIKTETLETSIDGQLWGAEYSKDVPLECVGTYHGGHGNAIFLDGHIEELPKKNATNKRHQQIATATIDACKGAW